MSNLDNNERPVYGGQDAHFKYNDIITEEHVAENRRLLRGKFEERIRMDKSKIREYVNNSLESEGSD